ncbi:MAG TPA: DUF4870 domain-containing protein [Verrucomicrobiae bacterium]|jgi:hypothetical protein
METPVLAQPAGRDKIWGILCHLSVFFAPAVGIVVPLVVYLAMRNESDYLEANAREALNFHITLLIYGLCCFVLCFFVIGFPLLFLLWVGAIIFGIIAAIKASDGRSYHYPLTLPLVS